MTGSLRKHRLQRALVVAQIAVSVVLLAGAGLLTRSMIQLSEVDTGLVGETEQVLTIPVPLLDPTRLSPAADAVNKELYDRMRREIQAIPGVIEVGLGSTMPLRRSMIDFDLKAEGKALAAGEAIPKADVRCTVQRISSRTIRIGATSCSSTNIFTATAVPVSAPATRPAGPVAWPGSSRPMR